MSSEKCNGQMDGATRRCDDGHDGMGTELIFHLLVLG